MEGMVTGGKRLGLSQGDGNLQKTERLILQFQGIRSPNSSEYFVLDIF